MSLFLIKFFEEKFLLDNCTKTAFTTLIDLYLKGSSLDPLLAIMVMITLEKKYETSD